MARSDGTGCDHVRRPRMPTRRLPLLSVKIYSNRERSCGRRGLVLALAAAIFVSGGGPASSDGAALHRPWIRHVIDDSSRGADGVRLGDANRDGLPDIVTGWEEGGRIRVYLHPGKNRVKQRWPAVTVGEVSHPEDAVFVDLDGDGALDVVSSTEGETRSIFVHWAPRKTASYLDPAAWETEAVPASESVAQWMFALPIPIDGRGGPDMAAGSKNEGAAVHWFSTSAQPRDLAAWKSRLLYKAGWIMSLESYDVDGDGDLDILASDRKGPSRGCLWLERQGGAAKTAWQERRIGSVGEYEAMFLTVADLDRDWLDDILVAVRGGPVRYFRRTAWRPPQWETHEIELPSAAGTGKSVAVGDVDRDGKPDVVVSCENAFDSKAGVVWMSYDKTPSEAEWRHHPISGAEGVKFDLVKLVDLDDDGDLDVITCEETTNLGVIWYENPLR